MVTDHERARLRAAELIAKHGRECVVIAPDCHLCRCFGPDGAVYHSCDLLQGIELKYLATEDIHDGKLHLCQKCLLQIVW